MLLAMKRFMSIALLLVLVLGFSACAPSLKGSNVAQAFRLYLEPVTAKAGSTVFVFDEADVTFFNVSLGPLSAQQKATARVGDRFTLATVSEVYISAATAPSGWMIDLERKRGVREVSSVGQNVNDRSFIELGFSIKIPEGIPVGSYNASASVTGTNGATKALPMIIEIVE